jgi:hypothetical protein
MEWVPWGEPVPESITNVGNADAVFRLYIPWLF